MYHFIRLKYENQLLKLNKKVSKTVLLTSLWVRNFPDLLS